MAPPKRNNGYFELTADMDSGGVMPVLFLCGPEKYLIDESLKDIRRKFLGESENDFDFFFCEGDNADFNIFLETCFQVPLFAEKKLVYAANPGFLTGKKDALGEKQISRLEEYIKKPNPSTLLVISLDSFPDMRQKVFKLLSGPGTRKYDFDYLKPRELEKWIVGRFRKEKKKPDRGTVEKLVFAGSSGLYFLDSEIEKILLYSMETSEIRVKDVEKLISSNPQLNVFALTDRICDRRGEEALEIFRNNLALGEPPDKTLALLATHFRRLLLVSDLSERGWGESRIISHLKMNRYYYAKLYRQVSGKDTVSLSGALKEILRVQSFMRSSLGSPPELMEELVMRLSYL